MKKIGIVTSTRADYGILKNTISEVAKDSDLELCLIVTGTHLLYEFGHTIDEIKVDGFPIAREVDIVEIENTCFDEAYVAGKAVVSFKEVFRELSLDFLILLGDRYEILAVAMAAMFEMIPIAHISGGEITEGAIDDGVRNCLTKLSYLHFPGCEIYRKRIVQMGEAPNRVFNFGDVGVENIYKTAFLTKKELEDSLGLELQTDYMCITYHPVTLEKQQTETQINELLSALTHFPEMMFIFTKANMDANSAIVNQMIERFSDTHTNCILFDSLGSRRYLSLLKYSCGIIGNSSSGIVEAPSLGIPTINIGNRQKGRLQAESILNCSTNTQDIIETIQKSQKKEFLQKCKSVENPYGCNNTSELIVKKVKEVLCSGKIDLRKGFYDLA